MQIEAACNCRTDLNMKCCTKSRNGKSIKIQEPEKNEMLYFILFFAFTAHRSYLQSLTLMKMAQKTTMMHDFLFLFFYLFSFYCRKLLIHESLKRDDN